MFAGVSTTGKVETKSDCSSTCCSSRAESTVTTETTDSEKDDTSKTTTTTTVEHIESLERWNEIFTSSQSSTLIVKFTADWCSPCKQIQPHYQLLSCKFSNKHHTFVTLDVDGDDCDSLSSKLKVAMMPTFICFRGGVEVGRMSGGNSEGKLTDWVEEMCS